MTVARTAGNTRWWTLGVVALGTFMLMLDLSVASIALPQIHAALHASFSELQWVFDAYALTLAAFLVTAGSLADRTGRRRMWVIGLAIFTLASFACGIAPNATSLNVSRGVQGVGAAILFAVGPALLGHVFHGKERATAFAVFGASAGLAIACGPIVGGGLTSGLSWRWIFFINLPVGVVALVVSALRLDESLDLQARRADVAGLITFTVAMGALVLSIIRGNDSGWSSGSELALYAVAVVMLLAFLSIERARGATAMFDLSLFRNPTFVGMSAVALIANGAGLPSVFIETNYVENLMHISAWGAGLRFLPLTLALFVFGAVSGSLIGKVPFRALMGVACLALGVGLLLTRLSGANSVWTALIPSMIVTGMGMGMFNPVRAALAIGITKPSKAGMASGINETFQQVGTAIGIAGIGAFFQNRVTAAFTGSSVGHQLGSTAHDAAKQISTGSVDAVAASAGSLHDVALAAARSAFTIGFHDAMTLCAICAFVATAVAVTLLRTKDLHASALSLVPPDVDEPVVDDARGAVPALS